MNMSVIDHVGYITNNIEKFESFWCDILGFKRVLKKEISSELTLALFGINDGGEVVKYNNGSVNIEIHNFNNDTNDLDIKFNNKGLNHICLKVDNKDMYLNKLPKGVVQKTYHNPGGWINNFILDWEGNWIEIR